MFERPETLLLRTAGAWTAVGLAGGVAYREITRAAGFTGFTQLAVVHTHALVLGALTGLVLLVLQRLFALDADRRLPWLYWTWTVGLAMTVGMLALKGTLQVLGSSAAQSAALAGIAGTGHIVLAAALVLLFVVLGARLRARGPVAAEVTTGAPGGRP